MGAIYSITCDKNGWVYVGEGKHPLDRYRSHLRALRSGEHHNPNLQHCFDTYGESSLDFKIVEHCSDDLQRFEREDYWINQQENPMNIQTYSTRMTQILKRDLERWYE